LGQADSTLSVRVSYDPCLTVNDSLPFSCCFSHYFGPPRCSTVGMTASFFGLGATLSNFLGQMVVEHFGHVASLTGSLVISIVPILLFAFMPETYGHRGDRVEQAAQQYKTLA
jgi:hypothetical protein